MATLYFGNLSDRLNTDQLQQHAERQRDLDVDC